LGHQGSGEQGMMEGPSHGAQGNSEGRQEEAQAPEVVSHKRQPQASRRRRLSRMITRVSRIWQHK
jgi:hypothetical protein